MFSVKHPAKRWCYAVTTGTFCGEMLFFMEKTPTEYHFLSLPKNINRTIPEDKLDIGLKDNIVEIVECVPKKVYALLEKQYLYNKSHK